MRPHLHGPHGQPLFCRALESTGVTPHRVATDKAAACPPARAAVLPEVGHETGTILQQAIERDQQHLKGRNASMRGFKTGRSAPVFCMRAWDELTVQLLAG